MSRIMRFALCCALAVCAISLLLAIARRGGGGGARLFRCATHALNALASQGFGFRFSRRLQRQRRFGKPLMRARGAAHGAP